MTPPSELVKEADRLRAEVSSHKSAIRRHREKLGAAAAALQHIEAECRKRGIRLVTSNAIGAGGIHGHRTAQTAS